MTKVAFSTRARRKDSAMESSEVFRHIAKDGKDAGGLDLRVLGVSSDSGLNKLDCSLLRYRQASPNASLCMEMLQVSNLPVPPPTQTPILNLLRELQSGPAVIPRLNKLLGSMFSNGIKTFCQNHNITRVSIDLVGTHTPILKRFQLPKTDDPNTYPLGWNTIIAAQTGLTVVFDFAVVESGIQRPQISPVAFVNRLLLRHPSKFRACLNIEELTNLSFIPNLSDGNARTTICHDCGPGSLLIDYAMRYCTSNNNSEDHDGKYAVQGKANQSIVDRFLGTHDYLRASPPLSIAREMFGDHEAQRLIDECIFLSMSDVDTVATITRITAQNILKQYHRLLKLYFPHNQKVDELFICGPGARNSNIIDYLEAELPESVITKPLDDIGLRGDANEAVCYAHLALEAALGKATHPSTPSTPASSQANDDNVRGKIAHGTNWDTNLDRIIQFSKGEPLHVTKDVRVVGHLESDIKKLDIQ
ncbi:hypothetical protein BKA66DRAFT_532770 [Pyrenochaeta sp. MPI-SDFR-AT-0127]|nr:hypothetical protein BKA66DRAFT_532770 [Pyrenochaeta sp. MPI-SDFR-AT-0127]